MKKASKLHSTPGIVISQLIQKAYFAMNSNPEECVKLSREALQHSIRLKDMRGIGQSHMHIGLGMFHQGELAAALEHYQQAESVFGTEKDPIGLRSVYNNIGVVYNTWKDFDKALEYYQKNLALDAECSNPRLTCTVLNNIGSIHVWSNDYVTAREYYQKALDLSRSIDFAYGESLSLSSLANVLIRENEFAQAMAYLLQAIEIRQRNNDLTGIINNYNKIFEIYLKQQDYLNARAYCNMGMDIAVQMNNRHAISLISLNLAEIDKLSGDLLNQLANLERCLALAIPENYRDQAVSALRELAHYYEKQGDYKKAIETYWKYQDIQNYLTDQSKNRTIQQLRIQLKVAEKEREMKLISRTNSALEKKNKLINRQKEKLQKAEKELTEWNHTLEQRVNSETENRYRQEKIIIQKSKLESLGRLAAGIAHEINQPLGLINIGLQNLFNKLKTDEISAAYAQEKAAYFSENIQRIRKIIDHVRLFSREQKSETLDKVDLREIVESALSMIQTQCKTQNIKIHYLRPSSPMPLIVNKYRLEQVILNLLSNAKDAVEEKYDRYDDTKQITIRNLRSKQKIIIEIEDNGNGIDPHDLEHIFEPFYTTKNETMGTGLGLSICYGIIQEMEGTISCRSIKGEGTVISIELNGCPEEKN